MHVGLWNNLGRALHEIGKLVEAEKSYREALRLAPRLAQGYANLGRVLQEQGQLDEAAGLYNQAIELDGSLPEVRRALADALVAMGCCDEAAETLHRWIDVEPTNAEAHSALAATLRAAGRLNDAIESYKTVVKLQPNHAQAHLALGDALRDADLFTQAAIGYREALRINPGHPQAANSLAFVTMMQGRVSEAIAGYRKLIQSNPGFEVAHSNLSLFMNYDPASTTKAVAGEYRRWAKRHTRPKRRRVFANDPSPQRKLRVGYITPAFRHHPVGTFLDAFLGEHNPRKVETYCYADVAKPDDMTQRLQAHADHWRVTAGLADGQVEQIIRKDKIDILVVAANHTAGHRLAMVACKPAPVQVSWLEGPPVTTGLDAVDYVISDRYQSPRGDDAHFVETVYRMPNGYVCYKPPPDAPAVGALPATKQGHVTFGCFNALTKINPQVVALWAKVLQRVPNSRLIMKTWALGEQPHPPTISRDVCRTRREHGIAWTCSALRPDTN